MENLSFINLSSSKASDNEEIFLGLKKISQKEINSKYFYNEIGSKLFDQISKLEEYYPTRKEIEILEEKRGYFSELLPEGASIIEFGSGSNKKIKKFLKSLKNPKEYIPIDISKDFLIFNAKNVAEFFPRISVNAICADFRKTKKLKKIVNVGKKNIGFFPGSTIGNFSPDEASLLMKNFAKIIGKNNFLVIGVDLRKEVNVMEMAYNDSEGITAKFNKNILNEVNEKTGLKFNEDDFDHKAYFNKEKKRIEMHLVSKKNLNIKNSSNTIKINKGESIHTENSYKYSIEEFQKLSKISGFNTVKVLMDKKEYFSIFFLKVY